MAEKAVEIPFVKNGPTPIAKEGPSSGHVSDALDQVGIEHARFGIYWNGRYNHWMEYPQNPGKPRRLARGTKQGHILVSGEDDETRRFMPAGPCYCYTEDGRDTIEFESVEAFLDEYREVPSVKEFLERKEE